MGRKRRGSQAFTFDQSEETLKQNESIVNLYQNKTFQPPEPQPIETINEVECVTGFFGTSLRNYFEGVGKFVAPNQNTKIYFLVLSLHQKLLKVQDGLLDT